MAAAKRRKTAARASRSSTAESRFTLVLEDIRGQFKVFGEALQGLREHMDQRFEAVEGRLGAVEGRLGAVEGRLGAVERRSDVVEGQLALLTDAVRTHTRELRTIVTRLDAHEKRIEKLEGAAE